MKAELLKRFEGVKGFVAFVNQDGVPKVMPKRLYTLEEFLEAHQQFYEEVAEELRVLCIDLIKVLTGKPPKLPKAWEVCDRFIWIPLQDYVQLEKGEPSLVNWQHEEEG